ncbi:hypothetical protein CsSME_00020939 [Camellia sinensis var. sinensis]
MASLPPPTKPPSISIHIQLFYVELLYISLSLSLSLSIQFAVLLLRLHPWILAANQSETPLLPSIASSSIWMTLCILPRRGLAKPPSETSKIFSSKNVDSLRHKLRLSALSSSRLTEALSPVCEHWAMTSTLTTITVSCTEGCRTIRSNQTLHYETFCAASIKGKSFLPIRIEIMR